MDDPTRMTICELMKAMARICLPEGNKGLSVSDRATMYISLMLEASRRDLEGFAAEVHPPQQVLDYLTIETDYDVRDLRFVVYNDAERGEWLKDDTCYCSCDACKYCEKLLEDYDG